MNAADELARVAKALYERGWMPGTAGNLSVRAGGEALVTSSGHAKGELTARDSALVRLCDSRPVTNSDVSPSAETKIHTAIYRATDCAAVVHAHPPFATAVASRYGRADHLGWVLFEGYELIKGFGLADPTAVAVPVFPNWPDVARIGLDVQTYLEGRPSTPPALLIAGHGATTWGDSLTQARDRLECLEALCQLLILTGSPTAPSPHQPRTDQEVLTR